VPECQPKNTLIRPAPQSLRAVGALDFQASYGCAPEFAPPRILAFLRRLAAVRTAVVFVVLLSLVISLQRLAGTETAGFGGAADEAAHYVTALMIRDFIIQGMPSAPVAYAERYYLHYPKVAFGIWPPLFHVTGAMWFLLFGPSTTSALMFVALITTLLALCIYLIGLKLFDETTGVVASVWFLLLPAVQSSASMFMMDMLCAALMLVAAVAFGRYLDTARPRYNTLFGLFAAAAVMTKYNAFALALLPLIAVVTARKYAALRTWTFWSPAVIVLALCGWWYASHADLVWYASQPYSTLSDVPRCIARNTRALASTPGWLLLPLVGVGCWLKAIRHTESRNRGTWAALFALMISVWMFHSVLYPTFDTRYLVPAIPAVLMFACAGMHAVLSRVSRPSLRVAMMCLIAAGYVTTTFQVPRKQNLGFEQIADTLVSRGLSEDSPVLVSSEPAGEGAFVAAVAIRDRRPTAIVVRGSKFLASSTWMGIEYHLLYDDDAALLRAIDRARVSHIVIDDAVADSLPHQQQLIHALRSSAEWRRSEWASIHVPARLLLFERVHALPHGRPEIQLDMAYSLGKRLMY
jgi:hypothetical protein